MGIKERQQAAHFVLEAALARLGPLPIPRLAAEIMERFRPETPNATPRQHTDSDIAESIVPDCELLGPTGYDADQRTRLMHLICEGLQALEHASLLCICFETRGSGRGDLYYLPTRRGLAALWYGTVEASIRADEPRDAAP
jgi:hypothetical protein